LYKLERINLTVGDNEIDEDEIDEVFDRTKAK
jgi:hypothetical protein